MSHTAWHASEKGEVHASVIPYVSAVEQNQAETFNRFLKLDYLYDPNCYGEGLEGRASMFADSMSENLIASNVDTVTAQITAQEVRPRMVTDDGDWSVQRNAAAMSWYAEGLSKLLNVHEKCCRGFHAGALKGVGLNKVYINAFDEICIEPTPIDDIVVDEGEVRSGSPRQLHQRCLIDRDVLKAAFPDHEEAIERSQSAGTSERDWTHWAEYRPLGTEELVVIESWYLPIGREGHNGYRPGRHTIIIDGVDLLDEEWHKPYFPFARFAWIERTKGWYAISLAERLVGHQRETNRYNWTESRILEQHAVPTTYVRPPDANMTIKRTTRIGRQVVIKGDMPQTVSPNPLSPQLIDRRREVKQSSYEESGVSRTAANAMKPAGLESGVALREYRDQTTQRFSRQERGFERFCLDTIWLALECAKELGSKAPVITRRSKYGPQKIKWREVESDQIRVQLVAASHLARTPAGRAAMAMEMAQAGVISKDMSLRLLMPNSPLDVEREMSLLNAALEYEEANLEEILDGRVVIPEPFQNLKMAVWRGQMTYMKVRRGGAPEDILEALHQYITQAAKMHQLAQLGAAPGMPANQQAPMPGAAPAPVPAGMPPAELPQAIAL